MHFTITTISLCTIFLTIIQITSSRYNLQVIKTKGPMDTPSHFKNYLYKQEPRLSIWLHFNIEKSSAQKNVNTYMGQTWIV